MLTVMNDAVRARIRAEMAFQHITQHQLADRIGRSPEYVSRRLTGAVDLSVTDCEVIGSALGVHLIVPTRELATSGRGVR